MSILAGVPAREVISPLLTPRAFMLGARRGGIQVPELPPPLFIAVVVTTSMNKNIRYTVGKTARLDIRPMIHCDTLLLPGMMPKRI